MTNVQREIQLLSTGEFESIPRQGAILTVRLNLLRHGFRATDSFLDSWVKLSAAGRFGTTYMFRKRVCEADHFQVALTIKGKKRVINGFVIWGHPVLYAWDGKSNPVLGRIMSPGWHVKQVGRSVMPPRFCQTKP